MSGNKSILSFIRRLIFAIFSAIAIISISTTAVLNMTFIYKGIISKYNLVEATGVSAERLMENYNGLIKYLKNPFIDKLTFKDFSMSTYGEIHFYEVKRIFIVLIAIAFIFLIIICASFFIGQFINRSYIDEIIEDLNRGTNILGIFLLIILAAYIIDFSKAFTIFHKIFFRNDYWIFDAKIDPVINALPEELFMIYGAIILGITILLAITIKVVAKVYSRKVILKESTIKNYIRN